MPTNPLWSRRALAPKGQPSSRVFCRLCRVWHARLSGPIGAIHFLITVRFVLRPKNACRRWRFMAGPHRACLERKKRPDKGRPRRSQGSGRIFFPDRSHPTCPFLSPVPGGDPEQRVPLVSVGGCSVKTAWERVKGEKGSKKTATWPWSLPAASRPGAALPDPVVLKSHGLSRIAVTL